MPPMMLPKTKAISDVFDDIRAGFAHVAEHARHVRINQDRLAEYARGLPDRHPSTIFDAEHHYIGRPEDTAAYVLMLDTINYGSGYKDDLMAEGWSLIEGSIYYGVSVRLKNCFGKNPLTAKDMADLTADHMRQILELPYAPKSREISHLFAAGVRDLGQMIVRDHSGCFLSFINDAHGRAASIVTRLATLPQFADVHDYQGHAVPLYKRAQIAAADLHLAFSHLDIHLFDDMERLTMFPDNGVPQVLLADGVLEYTPELLARITHEEEIASGSAEEIEIRACAGQVVEYLASLSGKTPVMVDHILWHRHAEDARYRAAPSHRTHCLFY